MDVYSIVTDRILQGLEKGVVPWKKTWQGNLPRNYVSERPYTGINFVMLGLVDVPYCHWLTWNQIHEQGGSVRKGEKSMIVIYAKNVNRFKEVTDSHSGETSVKDEGYRFARYYHVWNYGQTEGIPDKTPEKNTYIQDCESIIENMTIKPVISNGYKPCYFTLSDYISMPDKRYFETSEEYYAVLFHELIHWTGHPNRLNRIDINNHSFGNDPYSREELIAEIGASFLCNMSGIENQKMIENKTGYIESWLKALKSDRRLIMSASAQAQKAVNYILGISEAAEENINLCQTAA